MMARSTRDLCEAILVDDLDSSQEGVLGEVALSNDLDGRLLLRAIPREVAGLVAIEARPLAHLGSRLATFGGHVALAAAVHNSCRPCFSAAGVGPLLLL